MHKNLLQGSSISIRYNSLLLISVTAASILDLFYQNSQTVLNGKITL